MSEKKKKAADQQAKAPEEQAGDVNIKAEAAGEAADQQKNTEAAALEKAIAEKEEYLNALIRERADFENYKKRNSAAVSRAYADGKCEAAEELLPMLDNLERAIAAAEEESPLKTGVEMVLRQAMDIFRNMGIEEIAAVGAEFDPNLHNAVMQVDPEEGEESGIVKEVMMKGYRTKDKVLRHSMVKVIK